MSSFVFFLLSLFEFFFFFLFFQAEVCIRVFHVTGVQTCALPISRVRCASGQTTPSGPTRAEWSRSGGRSEERRVGKEGRSRWSPYHEKKKAYRYGWDIREQDEQGDKDQDKLRIYNT